MGIKTLKIGESTHTRLTKRINRFGMTIEDAIVELLDIAEGKKK